MKLAILLIVPIFVLGLFTIDEISSLSWFMINTNWAAYSQEYSAVSESDDILSCNCVAFRLDDIMDYKKTDVQIQIISTFIENDVPLTMGITGNKFGQDVKLTDFIKEQLKNSDKLEIANHGWNHESFNQYTRNYQSTLINQTNSKLFEIFGVLPTVFIPPFNNFEKTTIGALQDNNMTHMSSAILKDSPPYPLSNETFYRFPAGTSTGTVDEWLGTYLVLPHTVTFTGIEQSLSKYGFAVVMMHPKEFSIQQYDDFSDEINWEQIHELELLIKQIQDSRLTIVPIGKMHLDSESINIPKWIKNNAGWWADDSIDDRTFLQGIQFLIKENILKIPSTQSSSSGSNEIPIWIKNNAGWWADDSIDDRTFLQGIQYLISTNSIKLDTWN